MDQLKQKRTFEDTAKSRDAFEFCRASCRTSSKSTVHGNAYISEYRFCLSPEILTDAPMPADMKGLAGNDGVSCDDTCGAAGLYCDLRYLPVINTCTQLEAVFPCTGKCKTNYGHDQPAYVSASSNPEYGSCLTNSKEAFYSCSGSHKDTRRLCPCRPKPVT